MCEKLTSSFHTRGDLRVCNEKIRLCAGISYGAVLELVDNREVLRHDHIVMMASFVELLEGIDERSAIR